ncbi:MAG: translocation/assembly module TamB domain-containing protein [Geminicoccaceae bacterium]
MRRVLTGIAIVVGALCALFGAAFAVAQTQTAKDRIGSVLQQQLSEPGREATVEGLGGLIPFDIRLGRLALSDDRGTWLEVDDARVDLAPADLLAGRIVVREAGARRVRIDRAPEGGPTPAPEREPSGIPSLPESLPVFRVDRLYVDSLELGRELAGQDAVFRLDGDAGSGATGRNLTARLDLDRTDQPTATARLRADLDLAARSVDLALTASETGGLMAGLTGRPDAGALSVDVQAKGPLRDLRASVKADVVNLADLDAALALAVEPRPDIDLTGRFTVADGVLPAELASLLGPAVNLRVKGGQRDANRLALDELALDAKAFTVKGSGAAELDQRKLDGRITVDVPTLAAASAIAGTPLAGRVQLVATATGDPYLPEVRLDLTADAIEAAALAASRVTTQLDLRSLGPLDQGYAGVSLAGAGAATDVRLNGGPAPGFAAPTWRIAAQVPRAGDARIDELAVDTGTASARLSGTVDVATLGGKARLDVAAPDLAKLMASLGAFAPAGLPLAGSLTAAADAVIETGAEVTTAQVSIEGAGLQGLPPGAAELVGASPSLKGTVAYATTNEIRVAGLNFAGAGASLGGDVRAGFADRSLGGTVEASVPDLAVLSAVAGQPLKGSARAKASLGGTLDRPDLAVSSTVDALEVAGQAFRSVTLDAKSVGLPDSMNGTARLVATQEQGEASLATGFALAGDNLDLSDVQLAAPATKVTGSAAVNLASLLTSGRIEGSIDDLAALRPWHGQQLAGRIGLRADLTTPQGRQDATIQLDATDVAGDFGSLRSLDARAALADAFGRGGLDATVNLSAFERPDLAVDSASLTARGAIADAALTLAAKGQQQALPFDLSTDARVRMLGAPRRLDVERLQGLYAGQTIELRQPARLVLDKGVLDLDQLDLKVGQAQVQGNLRMGGGRVRADASLSQFPLAMLASLGGPDLEGEANARLALSGSTRSPDATLSLEIPHLHGDGVSRDIPPAALVAEARIGNGRLDADLRLDKVTDKPITASVQAPVNFALEPFLFDLPPKGAISGRLDGEADLARIAEIAALDGQRLAGPATVAVSVSGTLADPRIGGRVDIGPATIEDAVTGALYRDVRLALIGDGRRVVVEQLAATSRNGGTIGGRGDLELLPDGGLRYALDVDLANAEVLRNDLGTVLTSGKLGLRDADGQARLAGRLDIQRASLQIPGSGGPSIPTLDIVEAGAAPEPAAGPARRPFDLVLDVTVDAPARVFVRGRGLDSEWGGSVTAKGPLSALDVLGRIEFRRGFLDFLDRRFQVRSGTVTFDGARPPIPDINLEATAETASIVAVVKVTGPANDPKLELTSEPPLPRDEVLAQLLFGRDMSQITPAQGLRLANAVAMLDGQGVDLFGKVRDTLGLDTLDVAGQSQEDANLRAGKYIADNVYLEAQQGLQEGTGGLRMQIDLTPNLNVSTSVNDASQTGVGVGWKMDY